MATQSPLPSDTFNRAVVAWLHEFSQQGVIITDEHLVIRAWNRWLEIGLGVMGLRPKDFWNMTLVEWRAALVGFSERHGAGVRTAEAMGASELAALMRRFPDGNA